MAVDDEAVGLSEPESAGATAGGASRSPFDRTVASIVSHPVLTVAGLAILVGVVNLAWTAANRQPGGLDVDEVNYLTQAFRWQRTADPGAPLAVYVSMLSQDKGPVTMLLSAVALILGPNSVVTALSVSALLHGVSAVAVAGITNRLAGARAALVAGAVALAMPAAVAAARSYQLAPAVAAALTLAVWSLLASSRGRRLVPMLAFGASVGMLLLSRTMAVSFLPGLVLAAAVHLDRIRLVVRNAALSVAVTLVVAAPWWIAQRGSIAEYLFGHGYGEAAGSYGPSGVSDRALERSITIVDAAGPVMLATGVVAALWGAIVAVQRRGHNGWSGMIRSGVAVVWITVAVGMAALMTTANLGMYFELPLLVLAVAGVVGLARHLPAGVRRWAGVLTVAVATVTFVVSVTDSGGRPQNPHVGDRAREILFIGLANYQRATVEAEPRLGSTDRQVRSEAMEEWWQASLQVVREVDALDEEPIVQTVCGSGPQISAGTFTLAGELDERLRESATEWLSTVAPDAEMESSMQPMAGQSRRVVIVIDSPARPFPGLDTVERCAANADRLGWRTASRVGLPDGGQVDVLVHPLSS